MTHPLSPNLKSLSDKDLFEKLQSLHATYYKTSNPHIHMQIEMLIDDYQSEIDHRRKVNKENLDIDNLIKVV